MSLTNNILKLLGTTNHILVKICLRKMKIKKELAIRHDDKLDALTNKLFALLPYKMA